MKELLKTTLCNIEFENPFVLAAAPSTDNLEMVAEGLEAGWAGAVLKTTSVEGTPVPLKYPMITSYDFEGQKMFAAGNIDLISEHHIDEVEKRVKWLKKHFPKKVIAASIMGAKKEDWQTLVKRLEQAGVDIIECSFSCPQGTLGSRPGAMLGQDKDLVELVTSWVKEAAEKVPVVIKITPMVASIVEIAQAVKNGGGDAICASNTIPSLMGIDLDTFIPYPNVRGYSTYSGLSGPAIKPITLKVISEIAKNVDIPITGTGGAQTWKDAVEFMLVGARNIQICTAVMHFGFRIIDDLKEGLANYLKSKGFSNVQEIIGKSLPYIKTHDELPYPTKVRAKIDNEKCIKDGLCYIACKDAGHRAIVMEEDRSVWVDEEKCVGCGLCKSICPIEGCIKFITY